MNGESGKGKTETRKWKSRSLIRCRRLRTTLTPINGTRGKPRAKQGGSKPPHSQRGTGVDAWCEHDGSTRGQHRVKGAQLKLAATEANRRARYLCRFRNFVTSRAVGMEGWAPLRVTEIAATAEA